MTQTNGCMQGKICLVTGAASGIGEVTARALVQMGATVIVVATDFWLADTRFRRSNGMLRTLATRLTQLVMISPEQGAQTSIYLATSPEVGGVTGKYFQKMKEAQSSPASYDRAAATRLWQVSEAMTGLSG